MDNFGIDDVMNNPRFWIVEGFAMNKKDLEIENALFGRYLLRKEKFILNGMICGLGADWIEQNAPEYIRNTPVGSAEFKKHQLNVLLQEIAYLRSELRLLDKRAQIAKNKK